MQTETPQIGPITSRPDLSAAARLVQEFRPQLAAEQRARLDRNADRAEAQAREDMALSGAVRFCPIDTRAGQQLAETHNNLIRMVAPNCDAECVQELLEERMAVDLQGPVQEMAYWRARKAVCDLENV